MENYRYTSDLVKRDGRINPDVETIDISHVHLLDAARQGVRALLKMAGQDSERDGLIDTPARVVAAFEEMTSGYKDRPELILQTVFKQHYDEMVALNGIQFVSLCEHHLLPFTGEAAIGYVPSDKGVVGISKLARLVRCFARRLQIQERLTLEIAEALQKCLAPRGVAVRIKAHHHCMSCRGVEQPETMMMTSALFGVFRENPAARAEFFQLVG